MSSCAPGVELCTRCQTVHWVHVRPSPSVSVRSVRPFVRPSVRPFVRRPSVRPSVRLRSCTGVHSLHRLTRTDDSDTL